jgi:DNA-binding CsgD family transcriptional regulator
MVRVRLKGINHVTKRLADGTVRTYWYAWHGGPRLLGDPGDPEFVKSYHEAHARDRPTPKGHLVEILDAYQDSESFAGLAPRTAADYRKYLVAIADEFGEGWWSSYPREREVLDSLLDGRTSKEIAAALDISPKTVDVHRANVMKKMGVTNSAELMRLVRQSLVFHPRSRSASSGGNF